jgi:hypothetical protein
MIRYVPQEIRASVAATKEEPMQDVGVYVSIKGQITEIEPEVVGWQTGGIGKHWATMGMAKGHVNGKVMKPGSELLAAMDAVCQGRRFVGAGLAGHVPADRQASNRLHPDQILAPQPEAGD